MNQPHFVGIIVAFGPHGLNERPFQRLGPSRTGALQSLDYHARLTMTQRKSLATIYQRTDHDSESVAELDAPEGQRRLAIIFSCSCDTPKEAHPNIGIDRP